MSKKPVIQWSPDAHIAGHSRNRKKGKDFVRHDGSRMGHEINEDGLFVPAERGYIEQAEHVLSTPGKFDDEDVAKARRILDNAPLRNATPVPQQEIMTLTHK